MTQEAEVGRSLSLRPVRFTKQVPGWQGLCRETLSQNEKKKKNLEWTVLEKVPWAAEKYVYYVCF